MWTIRLLCLMLLVSRYHVRRELWRMGMKLDELRRSAAKALRAARAAKSAEEAQNHFRRAAMFKSLAMNLGRVDRSLSHDEMKRAFRTGRGLQ
jgi:hypothetical protein